VVTGEDEDFLRRSIADLDAEHAAGDLSDEDHAALRARYEAKLAAVQTRSGDHTTPDVASRGHQNTWVKPVVTVVVVAVVGIGAGLLLARSAGERDAGDQITGLTPPSAQGRLAEAAELFQEGDPQGAIAVYQELLDENPDDVAALTYFGWTLRNVGVQQEDDRLRASGTNLIDRALEVDPTFAEAWFFRGIIYLRDEDDPDGAADALRLVLANDPIPDVEGAARELLAEIAETDTP
jgi:tetratricopeptide (TPR) repeat protein